MYVHIQGKRFEALVPIWLSLQSGSDRETWQSITGH